MKQVFNNTKVIITRPIKKIDIKLLGLEESVTVNDIIIAIVNFTGCNAMDYVQGEMVYAWHGYNALWMQHTNYQRQKE
jgi:homoaconitase/3-isopropylmalate dehydratase large subunit